MVITALLCAGALTADQSYTDNSLEYTIFLPDNWEKNAVSNDTNHVFWDSSGNYPGTIGIVRHTRTTDYPTADDWTRAHFIAYKIFVDNSFDTTEQIWYDPMGVVFYWDSSQASTQDGLWAPELYSQFYSTDTALSAWSEYIRFTAFGPFGYELYALSDTADMSANIGYYAALIHSIQLPLDTESHHIVRPAGAALPGIHEMIDPRQHVVYDIRGQCRGALPEFPSSKSPAGFFIGTVPGKKQVVLWYRLIGNNALGAGAGKYR